MEDTLKAIHTEKQFWGPSPPRMNGKFNKGLDPLSPLVITSAFLCIVIFHIALAVASYFAQGLMKAREIWVLKTSEIITITISWLNLKTSLPR